MGAFGGTKRMENRPVVYLSTPMRKGHWTNNVRTAAKVAHDMMKHGFSVINPMGSWLLDVAEPLEFNEWLENDYGLILVSDCVYRIPGESDGADKECWFATKNGVPVYDDLRLLYEEMGSQL